MISNPALICNQFQNPCKPKYKRSACAPCPIVPPCVPIRSVPTWKINYLVSDRTNQAAHVDDELLGPWGIVLYNNTLWVINNGSDAITNYDLFGNKLLGPTSLRDSVHNATFPTGIVVNCCGGFAFTTAGTSGSRSSLFLTCSEHGIISAYNPSLDSSNSAVVINQQLTGVVTVYRGLALANNTLYAADFFNSKIDVFDSSFNRLIGFHFIDGDTSDPIPIDYGQNNIVHIGCFLYVLWARKDINFSLSDLNGPGNGYVSVFNFDGSFVRRFTSRGVLNSPWAIIPAPLDCGFPPGSFIIGNRGDGRMNVFDCNGKFVGPIINQSGLPIVVEGLYGLAPHYTEFNEIFFVGAGVGDSGGILGSIVRDQLICF